VIYYRSNSRRCAGGPEGPAAASVRRQPLKERRAHEISLANLTLSGRLRPDGRSSVGMRDHILQITVFAGAKQRKHVGVRH